MFDYQLSSWFYPKPTGDPGHDRNARTVQFACILLASALSVVAIANDIASERRETLLVVLAVAGLVAAMFVNRLRSWKGAARSACLALLLTAVLLVFEARDGFRSHVMLVFPGVLLLSVMLLDRASYVISAAIVLVAVASLGIAEKHGLTHAIPRTRTPTSYGSIFFVDLHLLVIALIGSRIARDAQSNVSDLRASIDRLSESNLQSTKTAEALHHSERTLRESEEQLASIYNTVRDVVFYLAVEPEGRFRFVSVNAAFLKMTELSRDEVVGRTVDEVIPEPSLTMVLGKYQQALAQKTIVSWEETSNYPTGELTGEVSVAPVVDAEGTCTHLVGSVHDIAERKRIEAALRENEERFRNMADTAPVMIWASGPDQLGTFFNKAWLDFTGRTMEQECGEGWISRVHPDDLDHCLSICGASFSARRPFQTEFRLRRADGQYRWILDTGVPRYRHGEFIGFIGSGLDLTERKLMEERLRANETRLKNAQRLTRIGSWERGVQSGNDYWSDEMFRLYGLRNDGPPTFSAFLNFVYPQDRRKLLEAHQQVLSSDAPLDIEFRIIRSHGEVRYVHTILEAVRNDRGVVVRTVGATQDITDQKRAQEESFARQKLESVGTLAGGIAHDFNNLLGAVLAQAELAMAQLAAGSPADEELKAIRDVAIRGSDIVRQLMIYAGKESDILEPVDVSKAVQGMLGLLRVTLSRRAALVTDLAENLPPVKARVAQIRQIVMNLVVNASDAIQDDDGVVRVTTGQVSVRRDIAGIAPEGLAEGGDYVQLEVSDTGRGMSQEIQARMFDPFFTTKSAGRGLGLAVVHGIVRSLHGTIRVVSESGKGTTFLILLPCTETGAPASTEEVSSMGQIPRSSGSATVLVVEDEEPLRTALRKMLAKVGFGVLEAANGSEAIELLRAGAGKIELLLLDLTIPGATSQEVLAEAVKARPDLKIILTSAYTERIVGARLNAPQVCGFVRKPFQFKDLVEKLRSALSSSAAL
jgi:PAS domain S-box-containing protein